MSFLSCVRQLCGRRVWVFGLGALGCLLAFAQWSLAQTFPGQQDPVGGPNSVTGGSPGRLILFPDDELAIISFTPVDDGSGTCLSGSRHGPRMPTTACQQAHRIHRLLRIRGLRQAARKISSAMPVWRGGDLLIQTGTRSWR